MVAIFSMHAWTFASVHRGQRGVRVVISHARLLRLAEHVELSHGPKGRTFRNGIYPALRLQRSDKRPGKISRSGAAMRRVATCLTVTVDFSLNLEASLCRIIAVQGFDRASDPAIAGRAFSLRESCVWRQRLPGLH